MRSGAMVVQELGIIAIAVMRDGFGCHPLGASPAAAEQPWRGP